jgi:sensor histidine kinase YesM
MRHYLFYLIFLISNLFSFSQDTKLIDSLTIALKIAKEDTNKVKLLNELSHQLTFFDFDASLVHSQKALVLSEKINYPLGKSLALTNKGLALGKLGKKEEALITFKNLVLFDRTHGNLSRVAIDNTNIASIYNGFGLYDKALSHFFETLNYFEKTNDKKRIAVVSHNIGNSFLQKKNYKKALEFYARAVKLNKELNKEYELAMSEVSIGLVLSKIDTNKENPLKHFKIAESFFSKLNIRYQLANLYINISALNLDIDNNIEALKYGKKALIEFKNFDDSLGIASAYMAIGNVLNNQARFKQDFNLEKKTVKLALLYYDSSLFCLKGLNAYSYFLEMYKRKAEAYITFGQIDSAYIYEKRVAELTDTIYNIESSKQIENMAAAYELDKKEQKNIELKQENTIQSLEISRNQYVLSIIIISVILCFSAIFVMIHQNKLKSQQRSMQLEQKLLRSQMNPHFLFNSLNAIQSVVLSGDVKTSAKYLASFSRLIRSVLESSRNELVSLEVEISLLQNYIELQVLRFENNIQYNITIDEKIDHTEVLLPPMLLQPFIENAFEHGFNTTINGFLDINFQLQNKLLLITVMDNGVGLETFQQNKNHISLARAITNERLLLLNKSKAQKIQFSISEAYPEKENKGVKVCFQISVV